MEEKITYFEEPGINNTETTLKLAIERAKARGIKKMVLASTRGDTARVASERLAGTDVRVESMHPGWAATPGVSESLPTFQKIVGPLLRAAEMAAVLAEAELATA